MTRRPIPPCGSPALGLLLVCSAYALILSGALCYAIWTVVRRPYASAGDPPTGDGAGCRRPWP